MILHRLLLENFRAIERAQVTFPERGVTVIEGPNESGKTSLVDGLEMLLQHKATSQRAEIKAACPVGRQVPVVVEAEFTIDGQRLIYRKQFVNERHTSVEFPDSSTLALTGDDAHDFVTRLLADTVDRSLWQALRIVQDEPLSQVGVTSGMDSLRRALDAAAGGDDPSGDDALIERVEAENLRYFTASKGAPTGELAASEAQLKQAQQQLLEATQALAELDDAVNRHTAAAADLAATETALHDVTEHLAVLEANQARLDELDIAVREAESQWDRARAQRDNARSSHEERCTLVEDVHQAHQRAEQLDSTLAGIDIRQRDAKAESEVAVAKLATAEAEVSRIRDVLDEIRAQRDTERDRRELAALERTLDSLRDVDRDIAAHRDELATVDIDEDAVDTLRASMDRQRQLAAQLSAQAPVVDITGRGVARVHDTEIDASHGWSEQVVDSTQFHIGEIALTVHPASGAESVRRDHDAALERTAELASELGVEDLSGAEQRLRRASVLRTELDALRRRRTDLLGQDTQDEISERAERLRTTLSEVASAGELYVPRHAAKDDDPSPAGESTNDEYESVATQELRDAEAAVVAARSADREAVEVVNQLAVERSGIVAAQTAVASELERLEERLTRGREQDSDAELCAKFEEAEVADTQASEKARTARAQRDQIRNEGPAGDVDNARAAVQSLAAEVDAARDAVASAKGAVNAIGQQGRLDAVAEADRKLADIEHTNAALWRRARAARLLLQVLQQRRREALTAYQAPFHRAVVELGRLVYERDFDVELSEDLTIVARRDKGIAVPYDSLSGGAREQLAVIVRIACARLVGTDGVPVFLDDTMGNTDPARRLSMGAVLAAAAGTTQLVVLTCDRARFAAIGGAHTHSMGRS